MTDAETAAHSGVAHGELLVDFAEAVVAREPTALAAVRERMLSQLGPAPFVDAAAVASNFERMVRIADATGIPLDAPVEVMTAGLRDELGIDGYTAAAHTPPSGALARTAARTVWPLVRRSLGALGKLAARRAGGPRPG